MRIGARDAETPILEVGDSHFDLSAVVDDIDPSFWADGPARITTALKAGTLPEIDIAGQRIGAPIARPASVICIGQNYAAHAAESGSPAPTQPIIFLKTPNTITGPFDDIGIPPRAATFDWEVELGVVIGAQAAYLESPEAARAVIGGYLVANDLSERDYQTTHSGGQCRRARSSRIRCRWGPISSRPMPSTPAICDCAAGSTATPGRIRRPRT